MDRETPSRAHREPDRQPSCRLRLRVPLTFEDDRATRTGARERDVKMITTSDCRVRCRFIVRDPFAKRVFLPLKFSGVRLLSWKLWFHLSLSRLQMNCASRISELDLLGVSVLL